MVFRHGNKNADVSDISKSMFDEFNTNDDFDSLSDKECHKSNSNK